MTTLDDLLSELEIDPQPISKKQLKFLKDKTDQLRKKGYDVDFLEGIVRDLLDDKDGSR